MPPKKAPARSKKTEQKKREKVIEDKTFGSKNKEGSKQQKYIQQVQKQVNNTPSKNDTKRWEEREKKLQEQRELAMIFKPVQAQKVDKGTDSKSVVCVFFKRRFCTKGRKCKFSHDLSEEYKAEKQRKMQEKKDKLAAKEERKKTDYSKGKQFGISGREMFSFNPDLVDDGPMENGDAAFDDYARDKDEEEDDSVEFKELDLAALVLAAQKADGTGTIASESRLQEQVNDLSAKKEDEEEAAASINNLTDHTEETPALDVTSINKDLFINLADELDDLDSDEYDE